MRLYRLAIVGSAFVVALAAGAVPARAHDPESASASRDGVVGTVSDPGGDSWNLWWAAPASSFPGAYANGVALYYGELWGTGVEVCRDARGRALYRSKFTFDVGLPNANYTGPGGGTVWPASVSIIAPNYVDQRPRAVPKYLVEISGIRTYAAFPDVQAGDWPACDGARVLEKVTLTRAEFSRQAYVIDDSGAWSAMWLTRSSVRTELESEPRLTGLP
jgi:hypothetical protein